MSLDNSESIDMNEDESNEDVDMDTDRQNEVTDRRRNVYLPGDPLLKGEELVCDESAYVMLHEAQTGSPCLSFDLVQNPWHQVPTDFPLALYLVAGTQAPQTHANFIIVMKMSNLHKTEESDSDESEEDSSDDEQEESKEENKKAPQMKCEMLSHFGCVNRVRAMTHEDIVLAASWSELGRVNIWDITSHLKDTDNHGTKKEERPTRPMFSFKGHLAEGYGLDWSSTKKGVLASGDCKCGIHIWHPAEGATWQVDQRSLIGHTKSVEDLQWSPNEPNVLASCSVDKSIRIWDVRSPPNKANKLTVEDAHELDVNVISWNRNEPFIVSGGDDGVIHVWDLRQFKSGSFVACFKHHIKPVTTVEWHPTDSTVFASGGTDNQIALWDIAVERESESNEEDVEQLPSQLLFIHQGQKDIKELHWHKDCPGVVISTAESGFNIFKTISV